MLTIRHYPPVVRFDLARTLLGRGLYRTSAYWVDGLMVDSGCAHTAGELLDALQDRPIERLVITHSHEDHIGANAALQLSRPDLQILAHPLALPVLANPRQEQPLHPYRRVFWGWPLPSQGEPLEDGEEIRIGNHLFQVIYTRGHSPDHLCLFEAQRGWLFTGDLFIGGKERALRDDYQIWEIIASLKRIARLPVKMLFPASAKVREDPLEELLEKIDYLEEYGERVLELHRRGWSEKAIAGTLFGMPMLLEALTLGTFSRLHLVRSYLRRQPA